MALALAGCAAQPGAKPLARASAPRAMLASFYGAGEALPNSHTANGEHFSPMGLTAAHRTLAFGTRLRVCLHGRCAVVRVNDRGPNAATGRSLDLSRGAAVAIGLDGPGVAMVDVEVLE